VQLQNLVKIGQKYQVLDTVTVRFTAAGDTNLPLNDFCATITTFMTLTMTYLNKTYETND
jgi:hypothetical protein